MTSSNSSPFKIKLQAEHIVKELRKITRETTTFGIVMDDKLVKITIALKTLHESTDAELVAYIMKQMQGEKNQS